MNNKSFRAFSSFSDIFGIKREINGSINGN